MPSTVNLATTTALTAVKNTIPTVDDTNTNLFWTWGWPGHRGIFEYWGVFGMLSLFLY